MIPSFWKLSQGTDHFSVQDIHDSIREGLVYVHRDSGPEGREENRESQHFIEAPIGDYFYLAHGTQRIYLLGQLAGPANVFSRKQGGWIDRPFRTIRFAVSNDGYADDRRSWAPDDPSGFVKIRESLLGVFEREILTPYFEIALREFGMHIGQSVSSTAMMPPESFVQGRTVTT